MKLSKLPEVFKIMGLVAVVIAFYSFVGVLLFDVSEQGQRDFPNWIEGVWTLWICVTTANYPDGSFWSCLVQLIRNSCLLLTCLSYYHSVGFL